MTEEVLAWILRLGGLYLALDVLFGASMGGDLSRKHSMPMYAELDPPLSTLLEQNRCKSLRDWLAWKRYRFQQYGLEEIRTGWIRVPLQAIQRLIVGPPRGARLVEVPVKPRATVESHLDRLFRPGPNAPRYGMGPAPTFQQEVPEGSAALSLHPLTLELPDQEQGAEEAAVGMSWLEAVSALEHLTVHELHAGTLAPEQRYRLPTAAELCAGAAASGRFEVSGGPEWSLDLARTEDGASRVLFVGGYPQEAPVDALAERAGFRPARVDRSRAVLTARGEPTLALPALPDAFLREKGGEPLTTPVGHRLVWVPPGRLRGFHLAHGFWMGETPLTQEQFRDLFERAGYPLVRGGWMADFSEREGDDRPVDSVLFWQAQVICEVFTRVLQDAGVIPLEWAVRLPSEVEWEYACRAGTEGPTYGELDRIAWHKGNAALHPGGPAVGHPVGRKEANPWGLRDMLGNVAEWCLDVFHEDLEASPADGLPRLAGDDPEVRVVRGGCYRHDEEQVRADCRIPHRVDARRDPGIGMRVVLAPRLIY